MVEEEADVGDDADGLAGAAVAEFGGDGGVDIDADGFDPAGEHVAGGDGVEHRTEAKDEAGGVGVFVVGVLGLVHVGDGVRQGTVITEAAGEDEGDVGLDALVHDAGGEAAGLDGATDAAGVIDGVDGAHVVAVAVLFETTVVHADAEGGAEESGFDVVDGEGVAAEQSVDEAGLDEGAEGLDAAGVDDDGSGDDDDRFAFGAHLLDEGGGLGDGGIDLAFGADLVAHEGEAEAIALLRFRDNADAAHADDDGVSGFDLAELAADGGAFVDDDAGVHALFAGGDPGAVVTDFGALVGGRIEIERGAAVAFDDADFGIARIDRGAAETDQLAEHLLHMLGRGGLDAEAEVGRFAVGATDLEDFYFEATLILDDGIEDALHDVTVDQVTLSFDRFLKHASLQDNGFMPEAIVWRPDAETIARAQLTRFLKQTGETTLEALQARSAGDPGWFTEQLLEFLQLPWDRPYSRVMDTSRGIEWTRWCVDGELNIGKACLARGMAGQPAVVWEGEEGTTRSWSYKALGVAVRRCAGGLRALGIGKGDAVGVHLPMMPETVAVMVALARIGAVAVPLFTGFGPAAIAARLADVQAKLVFTCNGYPRRGKVAAAKATIDEAGVAPLVVVVERVEGLAVAMRDGRDMTWEELCELQGSAEPERMSAEDPLLLIYTSGTTGAPKGILHTHCGFPVKSAQDMAFGMDVGLGTRISWLTDIGWMMGPWLIYGTLLLGGTMALYDGSPEHVWAFASRQGVEVLGVSPTLVRTVMGEPLRHEMARLRILASTGEPWTRDAWMWLFETIGRGRMPIINYSGGTEVAGGIVCSNPLLPVKPCAFSAPCLGIAADVVDENGVSLAMGVGELVIRQPWIGMARGFYKDPERYLETYWSTFAGVWRHGDFAERDADGFWYIHGRSDDTIKIAGKRVGPAEVETIVTGHPAVREAAAIGVPDALKGSALVVYCVRQGDVTAGEIQDLVARELGKPLRPLEVRFVSGLPKTRNGKVMRRLVRAARLGEPWGDVSNLENPQVLEEFR